MPIPQDQTDPEDAVANTPADVPTSGHGRLTIREIELVPIVVPLAQEYRGSFYRMENRATIITRVHTEEGIVGEAYAGDEDSTLAQICGVVRDEIAPKLIGMDAFSYERCWLAGYPATYDQLRDRKHRPRRPRRRRPRDLGRDRQGARRAAAGSSGAATATSST